MRIIAGRARGARLFAPRGNQTRPLTDLMRGAIFSRLGEAVVGARVLDLFAGTGAFGLEALSRGAAQVTFVERSREAVRVVERNIGEVIRENVKRESAEVICADVFAFVARTAEAGRRWDIVFAGPPYAKQAGQISLAQKLLHGNRVADILSTDGMLIIEHFKKEVIDINTPWRATRTLGHGDTRVKFLIKPT